MLRWKKRIRRMTYLWGDAFCIVFAFLISKIYLHIVDNKFLVLSKMEMFGFLVFSMAIYILIFLMSNVYEDNVESSGKVNFRTACKMLLDLIIGTIIIAAGLYFLDLELSRLFYLYFFSSIVILFIINRFVLYRIFSKYGGDDTSVRNILVVGQSNQGKHYIEEIRKHDYLKFNIIGYISIKVPDTYEDIVHLGNIEELDEIVKEYVIDEIAVARPLAYDKRLAPVLNRCQDMGITITMLLDIRNANTAKAHVAMVGSIPVLKLHTVSLNESQIFAKRILDVIGGMAGMIIFAIFYVIFAPLIKLESPGPVIFKQKRVGKNGRVFNVWKFRSMGVNAEAQKAMLMQNNEMSGHMFKMTNDPRVTKIGAFMRKTSIDEIPQFYNVLKGDMSLVGTRPPTVNEVEAYQQHHHKRISIMPGITGNWQVSGRSDIEDFEEVVRLDSEYIANWTIWLDIKILIRTVWVVFAGKGSR